MFSCQYMKGSEGPMEATNSILVWQMCSCCDLGVIAARTSSLCIGDSLTKGVDL